MRVFLWDDRTHGTARPEVDGEHAWWWTHAAPLGWDEQPGDQVLVEPEGIRWRVVAVERPSLALAEHYGPTLRSVRAERVR